MLCCYSYERNVTDVLHTNSLSFIRFETRNVSRLTLFTVVLDHTHSLSLVEKKHLGNAFQSSSTLSLLHNFLVLFIMLDLWIASPSSLISDSSLELLNWGAFRLPFVWFCSFCNVFVSSSMEYFSDFWLAFWFL